jgi:hypothetical protein
MSTLLEQASLVMIPSGYKEDVVYSQIPTSGAGDLSFTRASNGTRINSAGLVEDVPWNLLQQSNTFNTTWASGGPGGTVTSGQTDPNGGSTAWLLSKLGATGRIQQTVNVGGVQTFFIYAKKNTSDYILINVFDGTTSHECWFNLSTGAVGTQNSSTGAIESVGNGWYKCSVTSTNLIASGIIQIYQSDGNGNVTGASGSIYIFNSQLNIGSTAKPYFPTTDRLNVPRLTYQNGGGGCPSLLLEKQSTNLLTYSEQFDNAVWTKASATVSPNQAVSPDGTQNADLIYPTSSASNLGTYQYNSSIISVVGTVSCYVKSAGKNWALLGTDNTSNYNVSFDLVNGVVGSVPSGYTATIQSVGNGWYRITATFESGSSLAYPFVGVADNTNRSVTADGTNGLYIWGFQAEVSSYATSYIPTTSSSATRVADLTSVPQGTIANFGTDPFCVFLDVNYAKLSVGGAIALLGNRQGGSWWRIYGDGSVINLEVNGSNGYTTLLIVNSSQLTSRTKIAISRNGNNMKVYVNGSSVQNVTNVVYSSDFTTANTSVEFNAWGGGIYEITTTEYNEAIFFKQSLTATELASLTTI